MSLLDLLVFLSGCAFPGFCQWPRRILFHSIPSAGDVLRELDRARTPESKVRVWSRSLDSIDSIGWLLSITVGLNPPAEGIWSASLALWLCLIGDSLKYQRLLAVIVISAQYIARRGYDILGYTFKIFAVTSSMKYLGHEKMECFKYKPGMRNIRTEISDKVELILDHLTHPMPERLDSSFKRPVPMP